MLHLRCTCVVLVRDGKADNLMDHFTKSVLESGWQAKNITQASMDGPSVNWKLYGELKKNVNTDYGTTLINIWPCGLHEVHNSFKRGMDATGLYMYCMLKILVREILTGAVVSQKKFQNLCYMTLKKKYR